MTEKGQKPMSTDPNDYRETGGYVGMVPGKDGLPVVANASIETTFGEGLTEDSLICTGAGSRAPCEHYAALLQPAEGEFKGGEPLLQIRRFCTRLASATELMELTDVDVYACSLRKPQDPASYAKIVRFENKQRKVTAEGKKTSGKAVL